MADPVEGQVATPDAPPNPFAGPGTAQNIDRQKALLNDIIAMGGTNAAQLYGEQDTRTQDALRQRLAQAGPVQPAQQAIYDSFRRDAEAARQQHVQSQQRQFQLGNVFMEQAKGAVPMYEQQQQALTDTMRMQFEASARRDAEETLRQQQAAARAASGGGGGGSRKLTVEERIAAGLDDQKVKDALTGAALANIPKTKWTLSDATSAGLAGKRLSYSQGAENLGFRGETAEIYRLFPDEVAAVQDEIEQYVKKDASFEDIVAAATDAAGQNKLPSNVLQIILMANAPRWGVSDRDWRPEVDSNWNSGADPVLERKPRQGGGW